MKLILFVKYKHIKKNLFYGLQKSHVKRKNYSK